VSANPYTIEIDGEAEPITSVSMDWDVDGIATFETVLKDTKNLEGFDRFQIARDGAEVFDGRQEKPTIKFSSRGRHPMPVSGFDWTRRLSDFPTTSQSIVSSTTSAALTAILSETDFATSLVGTFEYITALQDWDTSIEFLMDIESFNKINIEYDLEGDELEDEFANGRTIADFGAAGGHAAFWYDGTTRRFYIFTREGNDIYYYHSTDFAAWTRADSAVNSSTEYWGIAWHDSKVYMFINDGANVDFYQGTINDETGVVTMALIDNNIDAGNFHQGPTWDSQGHMWIVVDNGGTGAAWESTDDGVSWNNRFNGPEGMNLHAVTPKPTDGDVIGIVCDIPANDLDEYLWDRSAGTFTYVRKIVSTSNDIDSCQTGTNLQYDHYLFVIDGGDAFLCWKTSVGGSWDDDTVDNLNVNYGSMATDDSGCAYLLVNATAGARIFKYRDGVEVVSRYDSGWPFYPSGVRVFSTGKWDEELQGHFFGGFDGTNDGWAILEDPTGLRLYKGETTGDFTTETVMASGAMQSWGLLTASGVGIATDVLWDILKAADSSVLADDQTAPFDLDVAGVDPAETQIKIQGFLTDTGTDPYVYEFDITEKTDAVSIDTDYEDAYTGVKKLADLAGAEFYVTYDGTTWTVIFTTRRGSDKSASVILKAASSSRAPGTIPNIKVISKQFDWSNYANIVRVIGGEDADGNRVVEEVRDNAEITDKGQEFWFTYRDAEITTSGMARQRAYQELIKRNIVTTRIGGEFIDKTITGSIEIGDSVMVYANWDEEGLEIAEALRIVKLHRGWGVGGEKITADFSNKLKFAQYWNYMRVTDDHSRWLTA